MLEWITKHNDRLGDRLAYQGTKIRRCLELVKERGSARTAVDIGSHVGLWSYYLADVFAHIEAFEPVDEHRLCYTENMANKPHYTLHPYALGDEEGSVKMKIHPGSSGGTFIEGKGDIQVRRLDDFVLVDVDLIKVDCEGYEYFALHGGEELIKACKPIVVAEQKPGMAQKYGLEQTHAVDYLLSLGYKLRGELNGDYFLTPRPGA